MLYIFRSFLILLYPKQTNKDMSKAQIQLQIHNQLRAMHNAPPLVLSEWLCQRAQEWADRMAQTGQFQHSDCNVNGKGIGQNIYWTSGEQKGGDATKSWYEQIKDYNYEDGENSWDKCGHFTQVVWIESQQVGFGYKNGNVVANYYPAGNLMGTFQKNVQRS